MLKKIRASLWFHLGVVFLSGCGVRGAPTPYVEAYPDKPKVEAQAVSPTIETQPSPTPTVAPSPSVKPVKKKKK